jgi:hypothetical protein
LRAIQHYSGDNLGLLCRIWACSIRGYFCRPVAPNKNVVLYLIDFFTKGCFNFLYTCCSKKIEVINEHCWHLHYIIKPDYIEQLIVLHLRASRNASRSISVMATGGAFTAWLAQQIERVFLFRLM